ncbi:MAG: sigma-54 dependent transcriptional regulator [Planctomycetota bacterium]
MRPFPPALHAALAAWNERARFADLLPPLLEWLLQRVQGERALFFTTTKGGGYRVRSSRNVDGEPVRDAERWISHFAVQGALPSGQPRFYPDTRADRRYRTEGEQETGARSRSILVVPVGESGVIYCDSRFSEIIWSDGDAALQAELAVIGQLVIAALRHEETARGARELERRLHHAQDELAAAPAPAVSQLPPSADNRSWEIDFHGFRTRCPELINAIEELRRLAQSDISLFISGESGTGKEVLARAVHAESKRSGPFVSIHCGAIPSTLVEIELFGHERGAFTGAEQERQGLFQQARGGTLFLDDVEEMSQEMQLALLRVLESGKFRPVSAEAEVDADVRVVCTSRHDPQAETLHGALREDLYYRLAGSVVVVPPLRKRREDVLLLARAFLQAGEEGGTTSTLTPDVEAAMFFHDWPGNIRELKNFILRCQALSDPQLTLARFHEVTGASAETIDRAKRGGEVRSVVEQAEREAIIRALVQCGGNKSMASRLLGLSRKTLYRRMEKHGIPK